jgi:hypothetical protein
VTVLDQDVASLPVDTSDSGKLEHAAVAALDAAHAVFTGSAPLASRAWAEGNALLVVLRGSGLHRRELARLQDTIASSVYLRTGELLRSCGLSADAERDLVVLAFERVAAEALAARPGPGQREPLADSG